MLGFSTEQTVQLDELIATSWRANFSFSKPPAKMWVWQRTPPFPEVWPVRQPAYFIYYVSAYHFGGLHDAQVQARPWAKVVVVPQTHDKPQLQVLRTKLSELGIQGVSPADATTAQLYQKSALWEQEMLFANGVKLSDNCKAYYCAWLKNNALLAREISPLHQEFIAALQCSL